MPVLLVHATNVTRVLFFFDPKLEGKRLSILVIFCNITQIRHSSIPREVHTEIKYPAETGVARCNPHNLHRLVHRARCRLFICVEI